MGHRKVKEDDPDMRRQRSRNQTGGHMRQKRSDTLASTLEREYDVKLSVRGEAWLDTRRKRPGETSVSGVIEKLAE